ncbi:PREDICTED: dol-P-Glc:Glc(2)Man(9)GlcNAc(2)-PP-Dol alpha-1,2-glucosyltransferase isoform X1 [Nanorana parkeri]|uniref:dol-P-Glc:Glc(2)Man(9)GlcNAc(2)-PP-Dol alpha-1,2-glucosyltransferase isoform X1 n=1 Tax=Nanorana parkeri TaxID=125878 RepID=UPI0008540457|nr:PREDICTED: dol-P-Glc:Glc(2)Man(9)GlcNAc(2)-PP-Dol alpha-1,2-glucosyltransferase isoform X1 [Nanorana parkeri]
MDKLEGYYFSALFSGCFLLSSLLFSKITREQRDPYMDEVFHIPQAQHYCQGHFNQWDPMITTLPGLYLTSVGIVKPVAWMFGWSKNVICSSGMLRFINLLFSLGNLYMFYLILNKLHTRVSVVKRILFIFTLYVFPTLFFFTFLYYTDAGSTFFVLFTYLMCLYGNHKSAALLGFCAFLFRQTNIIWIIFCAGNVIAEKVTDAWRTHLKKTDEKVSSKGAFSEVTAVVRFLIQYSLYPRNILTLLRLTWPYVTLVLGFLAFIVINGGIVVGDRSNHEACLNFPQLFYFFAFTLVFSFPVIISTQKIADFLKSVWKHPFLYTTLACLFLFLIWKFTYVHKYLIADNRHYTFYVWKKIFQRHELVRYLLVPLYLFAAWSFIDALKSKSILWLMMFLVCILAATIPQKLMEFRYFILPYLIFKVNTSIPSTGKLILELSLYIAINIFTFYLFLNQTFHWPDSEDTQRFMW